MSAEELVGQLVRYHGSITRLHGIYGVSGTHDALWPMNIEDVRLFLTLPESPERIEMSNVRPESVTLVGAKAA